jgi:Zn-finger nucleic acid-binding protein
MRLDADKEYLICNFCGQIHFPDSDPDGVRVLGEPAAESCPVCAVPLVHAAAGGRRIRFCQHCRGMLIAIPDFVACIDELRARRATSSVPGPPPDPRDLERIIKCPQCHLPMGVHPYLGPGNIIMDTCENCELHWLDHNELDRIVRAPDRHYSQDA